MYILLVWSRRYSSHAIDELPLRGSPGIISRGYFLLIRQKFVKKIIKKWVNRPNVTYVPKPVMVQFLLKLAQADKPAICFIRRYHISSVTSMVDGFL